MDMESSHLFSLENQVLNDTLGVVDRDGVGEAESPFEECGFDLPGHVFEHEDFDEHGFQSGILKRSRCAGDNLVFDAVDVDFHVVGKRQAESPREVVQRHSHCPLPVLRREGDGALGNGFPQRVERGARGEGLRIEVLNGRAVRYGDGIGGNDLTQAVEQNVPVQFGVVQGFRLKGEDPGAFPQPACRVQGVLADVRADIVDGLAWLEPGIDPVQGIGFLFD